MFFSEDTSGCYTASCHTNGFSDAPQSSLLHKGLLGALEDIQYILYCSAQSLTMSSSICEDSPQPCHHTVDWLPQPTTYQLSTLSANVD